MLERADQLSAEVYVLSLREGRSPNLYLCCGKKSELVVSCDGVYSEVLSKTFDSDVKGFLSGFSRGYILEEVVLVSDGSFSGSKRIFSVRNVFKIELRLESNSFDSCRVFVIYVLFNSF